MDEGSLSARLHGRATAAGTERYAEIAVEGNKACREHFRKFVSLTFTSLGMGTYLGEADAQTDNLVEDAIFRSVAAGAINVVDTAINYRLQKAERSVGRAIKRLVENKVVDRSSCFVCTKNGYLTSDGDHPLDFWSYVHRELIKPGKLKAEEIAGEVHSMSPSFLRDQFERSLGNLGLECIDLVYLHNAPESWIKEIGYRRFLERLEAVFTFYEEERRKKRLQFYGLATWTSLRVSKEEPEHLNLDDVIEVAKNVGGNEHGLRFIQLPLNPAMNEALLLKSQRIADEPLTTFEAAEKLGVGVFTSAPLAQGRLINHTRVPEVHDSRVISLLQFSRSAHPAVIAPLVGQKEQGHTEENLRLAAIAPLSPEDFAKVYGALLGKQQG